MKVFDISGNELNVGDDVAFTNYTNVCVGRIYKIVDKKIYATTRKRDERPVPDGLKTCTYPMYKNQIKIGHYHNGIKKLEGYYGNKGH